MPTTRSPRSSSALATWKPMKPAAPVRRIDIRVLPLGDEVSRRSAKGGSLPYRFAAPAPRGSSDDRALETTGQVFEAKRQPRLLNDLPQHRLAVGRKTLFEPIASSHEIVDPGARLKCMPDS